MSGIIQCSVAAPFLGGFGSSSLRSLSRPRLRPNWAGSGSRQKKAAPAPHTKICNFELFKKLFINASEKMLLRLSVRPTTQNNICEEGIYFSASSTTLQNFSVTVKAKDNRYRVLLKSQLAKFNFVSC